MAGVVVLGAGATPALAADACPNAQYRAGASAGLPDCRAYEQVSAQQKYGNPVWTNPVEVVTSASRQGQRVPGWSSPGGDRLLFNTQGSAGAENQLRGYQFPQIAERTDAGWSVRPAIDGPPNDQPLLAANAIPRQEIPSADRDALLFGAFMPFSPLQPRAGSNTESGAVHLAMSGGAVQWLSRTTWSGADLPPGTPGLTGTKFAPVAVSDDRSTAYFMTRQTLTPQDGTSGRTWDQAWALYKVKDGVLSNAGTLPDGSVDARGSVSAGLEPSSSSVNAVNNLNFSSTLGAVHVVSPDGYRALFVDVGNRGTADPQLYMHRDGQQSLLISKKTVDPNVPASGAATGVVPIWAYSGVQTSAHGASNGPVVFAVGDRKLGAVVFATRDALLPGNPDDGTHVNTYRYDVGTNTLEYLADLDRPGSASSRGETGNVYRVSDDATRILFWTAAGELKLWRRGLSTVTLMTGLETSGEMSMRGARFSADGKTVVFMSTRPSAGAMPGDPDHPVGGSFVQTQVYRFAEGVDTAPRCISCPPADAAEKGPASFDLFTPISTGYGVMNGSFTGAAESRGVSVDGRRVFFTTTSTLDPRDRNAVADVYEWSVDGGLALLSSGSPDSRGEGLMDVDATGDNVFFVSEQQLSASDTDDVSDVYVARVDGGLPDPPPFDRETGCAPGACQAPPSGAEPVLPPTTPWLAPVTVGATTLLPPEKQRQAVALRVRKGKASSRRIALRVRTPGPGKIRVRGSGLRQTSRTAKRSTTYHVHVRLSKHAREALRRMRRVRVRAKVRFAPEHGKSVQKTVKWTIKRGSRTSGRGR